MERQASQSELSQFVKVVDEFKANRARLISSAFRADVYASNNPKLISDYESAVAKSNALNSTIDATVGAWNAFKRGYASVTDQTSIWIGDAIDEVRSWFGYKPMGAYDNGLGALQIPAAAWVAGIIAAAVVLNKSIGVIFVQVEAARIQRETGVSRDIALQKARDNLPSLFGNHTGKLLILAGVLAGLYFWDRKNAS